MIRGNDRQIDVQYATALTFPQLKKGLHTPNVSYAWAQTYLQALAAGLQKVGESGAKYN